jgi:hypothetical protein
MFWEIFFGVLAALLVYRFIATRKSLLDTSILCSGLFALAGMVTGGAWLIWLVGPVLLHQSKPDLTLVFLALAVVFLPFIPVYALDAVHKKRYGYGYERGKCLHNSEGVEVLQRIFGQRH